MDLLNDSPVRLNVLAKWRELSLIAALSVVPPASHAQSSNSFLTLSYHARETLDMRDNDILRLQYDLEDPGFAALSRVTVFGGFQDVGINLGASSSDSSFDSLEFGAEALWAREIGDTRHGIGARIAYAETYEVSYELAAMFESFGNVMDYRLLGGLQGVTDDVPRRDDISPYGVAEATWWAGRTFLFRAGVQGDSDGALVTTGFEVAIGRTAASFFMDFGIAIDGYRGISEYNDLIGGFRFALGGNRGSLQDRLRRSTLRSLHRTIEVQ
ncbi:MAG: hypothetical protein AAF678_06505 [Pseudomonadota bacterium]